ncbi:VWA domain-containing protein [bacterium]|nr:VWA domain-containing protein [bacterium]
MEFEYPELLLLAIPLWFVYRRVGHVRGPGGWVRISLLSLLLLALAAPRWNPGGRGLDVIVVADRSLSLPAEAQTRIQELLTNLQNGLTERGWTDLGGRASDGNRLGLVSFGAEPRVEYELTDKLATTGFTKDVNPNGSNLSEALLTALDRVDPDRPARILVLSDGESNGADPLFAARRARERGVPIDVRVFERLHAGDVSIESVLLPDVVEPREPFQYAVWIHSDRQTTGTVRVRRGEQTIATQTRELSVGMNRLLFRDLLDEGGSHAYSVELAVDDDPVPENNRSAGLVRVDAGPRVLILNADGQPGNLGRAFDAARIPFDAVTAKTHPLTQASLDRYRTVVLENVPADDFGRLRMERLAQFVEDLGGGLLMTGGKRSFGTGGYFRSPLEDVLPVSMELREEHRKTRVAIAIALDRSGSMAAPVKGGKTKMDLANLGTAECVRLLSRQDMVSVIAVDSSPHIIQPLINVENPNAINSRVLRIESTGGGIFVYEALVAAGKELMKANGFSTRHIILFSDAADSEEPGAYRSLLKKFSDSGITVSVIGLGTPSDPDAKLLEDVAKLGSGNIMFTEDAQELPRLFTQDTMSIARNTFLEADPQTQPGGISGDLLPDARLMGELSTGPFPKAGGYNLSYLKPDATAAVVSRDEYEAPWSAFWYRGLGRAAAISLEVDGQFSGEFGHWERYADFLVTHVRWLLGGEHPDEAFVALRQDGQDAVLTVELDPDRSGDRSQTPRVIVVLPGSERVASIEPDLVWTGPDSLEARVRLDRTGTWRTLIQNGPQQIARGPSVTLPYSPEYAPRDGLPSGVEALTQITELSGGQLRTDVLSVFNNPPRSPRSVSLLIPLLVAAIALLLLEIAGRRLSLWERAASALRREEKTPATAAIRPPGSAGWFSSWKSRRPVSGKRSEIPTASQDANPARTSTGLSASDAPSDSAAPPVAAEEPAKNVDMSSLLEKARERARKRLE